MSTLNVNSIQHSNGTAALNIDSSGRITYPNRPLFSGTHTLAIDVTSAILTSSNCFDQIDYNIGSCFNASTGRFTATTAGYYDCSVHIGDGSAGSNQTNVRIRKNGVSNTGPLAELYNQAGDGSTNSMVRCIIFLAVGDYIDFEAARLLAIAAIQHKRFIIYLIG
jgi:hypothetical protein